MPIPTTNTYVSARGAVQEARRFKFWVCISGTTRNPIFFHYYESIRPFRVLSTTATVCYGTRQNRLLSFCKELVTRWPVILTMKTTAKARHWPLQSDGRMTSNQFVGAVITSAKDLTWVHPTHNSDFLLIARLRTGFRMGVTLLRLAKASTAGTRQGAARVRFFTKYKWKGFVFGIVINLRTRFSGKHERL